MNEELKQRIKAVPYWYHKIELVDGIVTPGWSPIDASRYNIPDDLTGKSVLDIGSWDGFWTWEALKRGADSVVAIDDFSDHIGQVDGKDCVPRNEWETFDICREALGYVYSQGSAHWKNAGGQSVSRHSMSVYDLKEELGGQFDVVFFFGTIYHLKHPLLALEAISSVSAGSIYVETACLDDYSPYTGSIGHGFNQNECVMEFYPERQYGNNDSNWWAPTLECLGAMLRSVGYQDIDAWGLTDQPKDLSECRGFAVGTKDPVGNPVVAPDDITEQVVYQPVKVAAVMSVPRLGFQDNMECAFSSLFNMRIPLINVQGAFWGQCLERGMQQIIDSGADIILTIDYDTVFTQQDVEGILKLMREHPEASAVIPMQVGRGNRKILTSMKTLSGQPKKDVPVTELEQETIKVASGHFGLTAIRVKDILDIPHPWFHDKPNIDGQWGPGRVDADIWFWKLLEQHGKTALMANRIVVGHLELLCTWPDKVLNPIHQMPGDFRTEGKPKDCWT